MVGKFWQQPPDPPLLRLRSLWRYSKANPDRPSSSYSKIDNQWVNLQRILDLLTADPVIVSVLL